MGAPWGEGIVFPAAQRGGDGGYFGEFMVRADRLTLAGRHGVLVLYTGGNGIVHLSALGCLGGCSSKPDGNAPGEGGMMDMIKEDHLFEAIVNLAA
jgi:hypothetical protein